jgi:hypothetical protein
MVFRSLSPIFSGKDRTLCPPEDHPLQITNHSKDPCTIQAFKNINYEKL